MKNKFNKDSAKNKGQSLVEMIMAVGVITLVLVALISIISFSLANVQYTRNKTMANKYAQETAEWLRNERNNNWGEFYNRINPSPRTYCFITNLWEDSINGSCTEENYIFGSNILRREVTLTRSGSDKVIVNIKIKWNQGSRSTEINLDTFLTSW